MNEHINPGFLWTLEHIRNGEVIDREVIHNLLPTEGANHALDVLLHQATQIATWYIGLYEGNYTPLLTDTAATFPASATELTTYAEASRVAFVESAASGGVSSNAASKAEFTSNSNKIIYGGFITSASAKGATSGILLSAVKFSSPKTFDSGDIFRATAGFTLASV